MRPHASIRTASLLLAALATFGCSEERERSVPVDCEAYDPDLSPELDASCGGCHGDVDPEGDYVLTSYEGVLGGGTDATPNAIEGDASSELLVRIDPATATVPHGGFDELHPRLVTWVVDCGIDYREPSLHEPGVLNADSDDWHGQLLRDASYDYDECRRCHGDDFSGGISGVACSDCHEDEPTECVTCHTEDLLDLGGHGAHVDLSDSELDFDACTKCHTTPSDYADVGHILLADGTVDPPPVELVFGDLASLDPSGDRVDPPSYDFPTSTCAQVYCHGDVFVDTSATLTRPDWNGADQATCGTCHGGPPSNHASDACETCHQQVRSSSGWVDEDLHVDGIAQLGRHGPACDSCHGTQGGLTSPPLDLVGDSSTTLVTVGAHQSHVAGSHGVAVPLACGECHVEPSSLDDPGHIDDALPADVTFGALAQADGAMPTWDRVSGTCSGVYCHGGGTRLGPSGDTSPDVNRTPDWTAVNQGEAACGRCHGIAPTGGIHTPMMGLTDCASCHPATVDAFGGIIITGAPDAPSSQHLNGMNN